MQWSTHPSGSGFSGGPEPVVVDDRDGADLSEMLAQFRHAQQLGMDGRPTNEKNHRHSTQVRTAREFAVKF